MLVLQKKSLSVFIAISFLFISGCLNTPNEINNSEKKPPIVLFWTDYPQLLKNITHITPHVWVESSKSSKDTNPYLSQEYLMNRGILPLRWMGGMVYAKKRSEDDFFKYWCSPKQNGYVGIAIDEFGSWNKRINIKMGNALIQTKNNCPDLFIAVWHAGPLTKQLAEAYREGADLILVESYFSGASFLWFRFANTLKVARESKIIHKTIFALGINDNDMKVMNKLRGKWANTPEELEAQMRWIQNNAPDMPGIAFFAPRASLGLLLKADDLAGEIFR